MMVYNVFFWTHAGVLRKYMCINIQYCCNWAAVSGVRSVKPFTVLLDMFYIVIYNVTKYISELRILSKQVLSDDDELI